MHASVPLLDLWVILVDLALMVARQDYVADFAYVRERTAIEDLDQPSLSPIVLLDGHLIG